MPKDAEMEEIVKLSQRDVAALREKISGLD
jgi:hypothetical protein